MSSASQPVLPVSPPTENWSELSIVDRILRAADWPELKRWAEVALGPSSFELGVCCGIVENVAGSVIGLLDLLKTFILAGLYTRARLGLPWWDVVGLPEYLVAKGAELVIGAELKKAHDTCEALMRQVMYVVKHPREFLKTTKDNYLRQYTEKWELFQRLMVQTDLTSKFRAGEIFGEVLLDVIMLVLAVWGAAEAAAKLAGEIPELVKLAENLKGVLEVKPGSFGLRGAAGTAEEAATAADAAEETARARITAGEDALQPSKSPEAPKDLTRAVEPGSNAGHSYAKEVLEGGTGTALTGHGEYRLGSGNVTVPEGTFVTLPRDGIAIADKTGQFIEAGDWEGLAAAAQTNPRIASDLEGMATYLPGAEIPNYTLKAPDGLTIYGNSINVEEATPLSDLLQPNMGCVQWAACTKLKR